MFKGTQNVLNKISQQESEATKEPGILPILRACELLSSERYQLTIKKLPSLLNLDELQFDNHCAILIDRFAEYVQQLPETQNSYFSKLGGMLDHGLHRAVLATSLARTYFLPEEVPEDVLSQQQILWAYAVFSAGLLFNIGKIIADLKIEILDRYTDTSKLWNPWEGSMVGVGGQYKYTFSDLDHGHYSKRATLLLARQLMPIQSYLWLASDPDVFMSWLAMLEDDQEGGGILGILIPTADAQVLKQNLLEMKNEQQHDKNAKKDTKLSDIAAGFIKPTKREGTSNTLFTTVAVNPFEAVSDFMEWTKKSLEEGKLKLNNLDSGIIKVREGVLVTGKALEQFIAEHPQYKHAEVIANAFKTAGLNELGPNQQMMHQYTTVGQNAQTVSGLVIKNANMLIPSTVTAEVHQQTFAKIPFAMIAPAGAATAMLGQAVQQAVQKAAPSTTTQTAPAPPQPPTPTSFSR